MNPMKESWSRTWKYLGMKERLPNSPNSKEGGKSSTAIYRYDCSRSCSYSHCDLYHYHYLPTAIATASAASAGAPATANPVLLLPFVLRLLATTTTRCILPDP